MGGISNALINTEENYLGKSHQLNILKTSLAVNRNKNSSAVNSEETIKVFNLVTYPANNLSLGEKENQYEKG